MRRFIAVVFILALAVSCQNKNPEKTFLEKAATPTDTATQPGSPGGAAVVPEVTSGKTVIVALEDGRIVVNDFDRIPPGPAILTITNTGEQTHNLFVEGLGVQKALDNPLAPDTTGNLDVTLQPGTYTLYCPILDHRTNGETLTLTIKATSEGATSTVR